MGVTDGDGGSVTMGDASAASLSGVLFAPGTIVGVDGSFVTLSGLGVRAAPAKVATDVAIFLVVSSVEVCAIGWSWLFKLQAAARIATRVTSVSLFLGIVPLAHQASLVASARCLIPISIRRSITK